MICPLSAPSCPLKYKVRVYVVTRIVNSRISLVFGETRLLSGYADYTVWHKSQRRSNLSTNLIVVEAKKINSTDTCLGQLTAYMGIAHACRKDEQKQNSVIYGAASEGLSFRFCRIDNEGGWSQSRLIEWEMGDKGRIHMPYSGP